MATWQEIKSYIHSNYKVQEDAGELLTLVFSVDGGRGRSQLIHVLSFIEEGNPLSHVVMFSPIGEMAQIDAGRALKEASQYTFGVGLVGDLLGIKHTQLSATIDPSEIDVPFDIITEIADALEKALVGGDRF